MRVNNLADSDYDFFDFCMEVVKMNNNTRKIKELLDQATILKGDTDNIEIARYLSKSNVVAFPVGVGDTVYFLSVKTQFGSLLSSGVIVKREVDSVAIDEKGVKIISMREAPNDPCGNLYEYYGERVFDNRDDAESALASMKRAFVGGEDG